MSEEKCVACGDISDDGDGFVLGRLCYHCIEKTVVTAIKQSEKYQKIEDAWLNNEGSETIDFLRVCKEVIDGVEVPRRKSRS